MLFIISANKYHTSIDAKQYKHPDFEVSTTLQRQRHLTEAITLRNNKYKGCSAFIVWFLG